MRSVAKRVVLKTLSLFEISLDVGQMDLLKSMLGAAVSERNYSARRQPEQINKAAAIPWCGKKHNEREKEREGEREKAQAGHLGRTIYLDKGCRAASQRQLSA